LNKEKLENILIKVKIIPNSSKNDIVIEEDFIKVKVTAQPIENKANKALIEVISKKLKIPKTSIEIIKGLTSKEKTILIKTSNIEKQKEIKELFKI
jgi:uncharacterized protein (TIGR00251 family)